MCVGQLVEEAGGAEAGLLLGEGCLAVGGVHCVLVVFGAAGAG